MKMSSMAIRHLGSLALLGAVAAAHIPAFGDTDRNAPGFAGAVYGLPTVTAVGVLTAEREALSAFSETEEFRRVTGMPVTGAIPVPGDGEGAPADALAALDAKDQAALDAAGGAQDQSIMKRMTADTGGAIALAEIENLDVAPQGEQWACLAEALYFEARGESLAGQVAVAEVILNRVDSGRFPDTICGVVNQSNRRGCQFSYTCDGHSDVIREKAAYEQVGKVAWVMMQGRPRTLTGHATHYHTTAVRPKWSRKFVRTAKIGSHIFYRMPTRISRN